MRINISKYIHYLLTGYFWGRTVSIMFECIEGVESWKWCVFHAFVSVLFTAFDIIEIKAIEKKWFDTEEETSILGARVYGTEVEREDN